MILFFLKHRMLLSMKLYRINHKIIMDSLRIKHSLLRTLIGCIILITHTVVALDAPTVPSDCPDGTFYASWLDPVECKLCGKCKDNVPCDKGTQLCPDGCEKWFAPHDACWGYLADHADYTTLAHITDGPEVKTTQSDRIEVCFYQSTAILENELGRYYAYRIQYAKVESETFLNDKDYIPVQDEATIHRTILNLYSNTEYKFRVALYRVWQSKEYDDVNYSAVSFGKTDCNKPDRPQIVKAYPLPSLTSVYLEWEPLPFHGCDSYESAKIVYYNMNETSPEWQTVYVQADGQTSVTIYGLLQGAGYVFWITTKNNEYLEINSFDVPVYTIEEEINGNSQAQIDDEGEDDDTLLLIAIALGAAAIVIAIIAIVAVICLCFAFRRMKHREEATQPPHAENNYQGVRDSIPPNPPPLRNAKYEIPVSSTGTENRAYDSLNHTRAYDSPEYTDVIDK